MFVLVTKQTDIHGDSVFLTLFMNMHQFVTLKYYFFLNPSCLASPVQTLPIQQ